MPDVQEVAAGKHEREGAEMMLLTEPISHYDLSKATAEWAIKSSDIALFEYQSWASSEFPDCLVFHNHTTTLYEVKVSRPDFLRDREKPFRKLVGVTVMTAYYWEYAKKHEHMGLKINNFKGTWWQFFEKYYPKNKIIQEEKKSALGRYRYYVCPAGLIDPGEVGDWGLYWFKNGRFTKKKESATFRRNMHAENAILVHALRKIKNEGDKRVLVKPYQRVEATEAKK